MAPRDRLDRSLGVLRISVTDRCNLRCGYCMPKEVFGSDYPFLHRSQLLSFEEIVRVARVAADLGVQKIRVTGGEPLVRRDLPDLVTGLSTIAGIEDLALTSNGVLLPRFAERLKQAGLHRLTVSLDSVEEGVVREMSGSEILVDDVLNGIDAAVKAGFKQLKINCVVRRGVNHGCVLDLARHFRGTGHVVRFIEFMDVGNTNGWRLDQVVSAAEIRGMIDAEFPLRPVDPGNAGEVARRWEYVDGEGEIGIISSVTHPFCGECSRLRLSPEGQLFTCLFASHGTDVRQVLRDGSSDSELREFLEKTWTNRSDRYSETRTAETTALPKVEMSYIGG